MKNIWFMNYEKKLNLKKRNYMNEIFSMKLYNKKMKLKSTTSLTKLWPFSGVYCHS